MYFPSLLPALLLDQLTKGPAGLRWVCRMGQGAADALQLLQVQTGEVKEN